MVLAVTNDEYELIVYMTESQKAMARLTGVNHCTISRQCRGLRQSAGKLKFVKVEIDDDDSVDCGSDIGDSDSDKGER